GLAAAGDEQNLLDTVLDQLFDHVLHYGLARHRQHLLGLRLGRGQQPRTDAGYGNDCAFDHLTTIFEWRQTKGEWTRRSSSPSFGAGSHGLTASTLLRRGALRHRRPTRCVPRAITSKS